MLLSHYRENQKKAICQFVRLFKNGAERMTVTTEAIKPLRWIAQNKTMLKEYDTSMATAHFEYSKMLFKEEVMNGLMSRGVDTTLHAKSGCF